MYSTRILARSQREKKVGVGGLVEKRTTCPYLCKDLFAWHCEKYGGRGGGGTKTIFHMDTQGCLSQSDSSIIYTPSSAALGISNLA